MVLSHQTCLELLANPSTQNILEKLGFEYSTSGLLDFRTVRPNIVPFLVHAIVGELQSDPIFPVSARNCRSEIGLHIERSAEGFAVFDIDKPSVVEKFMHSTAESAARSYVYRLFDPYWLEPDKASVLGDQNRVIAKGGPGRAK